MIKDEAYSVICKDIEGGMQYNQDIVLRYCVSVPFLQGRGASLERINGFYRMRSEEIVKNVRKNQFELAVAQYRELWRINSFEPLQTDVSCSIMYQGENLISAFRDHFENNRVAGCSLKRESHTWDLARGNILPIWSFFKTTSWRNVLLSEIEGQIRTACERVPDSFYPDWKKRLNNIEGYYLTSDGIAAYYRSGYIAPLAGAIPTFLITYDSLRSVLTRKL